MNVDKQELLNRASASLDKYMDILRESAFATMPRPSLSIDQRGAVAGSARLQQQHIRLNPKLYWENKDFFESQVLPHELAHLVVYYHFGKVKPHGVEWKNVMQEVFKKPAHVTHKLDLKSAGIRRFTYYCGCNEVEFTAIRHNKVQKGKQQYICRSCSEALRYAGA